MSSINLSAGVYNVNVSPAVQVSGTISEVSGGPYEITLQYYNNQISFTTRPTLENGSLGNQPEFS